jgi:hypothetical protein
MRKGLLITTWTGNPDKAISADVVGWNSNPAPQTIFQCKSAAAEQSIADASTKRSINKS